MSRLPLLLCVLLGACASETPPPGALIGTFAFRAVRAEVGEPGDCPYPGSPDRLDFDGTLSHDGDRLYLQIGGVLREGTLDGNVFDAALLLADGSGPRGIPRKLRDCGCEMRFFERFEGQVVRDPASDCLDDPGSTETPGAEAAQCPGRDERDRIDWGTCGGLCGTLREEVRAPADCLCGPDDAQEPAPPTCQIQYRFQAERIGGDS